MASLRRSKRTAKEVRPAEEQAPKRTARNFTEIAANDGDKVDRHPWDSLKNKVIDLINEDVYKEMLRWVRRARPKLISCDNDSVLEVFLVLCMWKDIHCQSYKGLARKVDTGFAVDEDTVRSNIHVIRKVLAEWSDSEITPGNTREWLTATRKRGLHGGTDVGSPKLIIDVRDFPLSIDEHRSHTHDELRAARKGWSQSKLPGSRIGWLKGKWDPEHKEWRPALRYLLVWDLSSQVVFIDGPFSLSISAAARVTLLQAKLEATFAGVTFIADSEFTPVAQISTKFAVDAPTKAKAAGKKKKKKKRMDEEEGESDVSSTSDNEAEAEQAEEEPKAVIASTQSRTKRKADSSRPRAPSHTMNRHKTFFSSLRLYAWWYGSSFQLALCRH